MMNLIHTYWRDEAVTADAVAVEVSISSFLISPLPRHFYPENSKWSHME
jgi:hypothetical protein